MIVAFDFEHTRQSNAGTARYADGLVAALRSLGTVEVVAVGGGPLVARHDPRKRLVTAYQDFLWYPWLGRWTAHRRNADVYHTPIPRGPVRGGRPPTVVTVHDLVHVHFPETMTPWSRAYARATFGRVVRTADLVFAVSQNTADDLRSVTRVSYDRIRVVPNGVSEVFFGPPPPVNPVVGPYVLFVGTPEPRKNLHRLSDAVAMLRSRGRPERLVLAGSNGWGNVDVQAAHVHSLGRVDDRTLHALYSHASCLALPSLHEGFGLPAIEAMAVGTPVVAGRVGALPEVTGAAAVLVDPLSTRSIADGLERAIDDRENLSAAGKAHAREFRWERAARAVEAGYRELA